MLREFRDFVARGNVLDLAVAVIIAAAFAKITTSLTEDVIMPIVSWIFGGLDFSSKYILLGPIPADYHGPMAYAGLKAAGVAMLGWGAFVTVVINFLILAFVIFLLVRAANRMTAKPAEAPPEPAAEPADVALLREIRDELRKKG
jgi:large conductance mechanosensitive channel